MIGRLSTEHVAIINATGALRRVVLDGDGTEAATAVEELAALLDPHTRGEEQGLFAELHLDEDFADHVDALCAEHREIDARLASWMPPAVRYSRGVLAKYAAQVSSASLGAVTD